MPRITIRQFRAALADAADQSRPTRAYREIARRRAPERRIAGDWVTWPPAAAAVAWKPWPDAAGARA